MFYFGHDKKKYFFFQSLYFFFTCITQTKMTDRLTRVVDTTISTVYVNSAFFKNPMFSQKKDSLYTNAFNEGKTEFYTWVFENKNNKKKCSITINSVYGVPTTIVLDHEHYNLDEGEFSYVDDDMTENKKRNRICYMLKHSFNEDSTIATIHVTIPFLGESIFEMSFID